MQCFIPIFVLMSTFYFKAVHILSVNLKLFSIKIFPLQASVRQFNCVVTYKLLVSTLSTEFCQRRSHQQNGICSSSIKLHIGVDEFAPTSTVTCFFESKGADKNSVCYSRSKLKPELQEIRGSEDT